MDEDQREQLREALRDIIREELELSYVPIGDKWIGGKLVLVPRDRNVQSKEVPIDRLFHKICMVRDRLRVLEQKINTHPKLEEVEKIDIQQYITRCYGSLTTFNVLFQDREDGFIGETTKS